MALRLGACGLAGALLALAGGWPGPATVEAPGATEWALLSHPVVDAWAWLLAGLGMVLFFGALSGPGLRLRQVALLSAVFGLVWQAVGTWWLYIGLHKYAELSAVLSVAAVAALSMYLTAYTVATSLLWAWLVSPRTSRAGEAATLSPHPPPPPLSHPVLAAALLAASWLLAELGRAMVMTGFPWAASGYAHTHGPLRPLVPWLGVYGTAAVAAFLAALLVLAGRQRAGRWAASAVLVLVLAGAAALADRSFTRSSGEFDVLLLQGNVSQDGKFDPARLGDAMAWHVHELSHSFADLTIAPETALPVFEDLLPAPYWASLRQRAQARPGALLFGMPQRLAPAGAAGHLNAMVALGHPDSLLNAPADGLYRYHKHHLVPFGEFTPWGFGWFTQQLKLPLPAFQSGPDVPASVLLRTRSGGLQRVAPLVCFEDLFGEDLARRFRDEAQAPTVLANGSNLAWFDDSPAIAQHLRIALFRTLEFERPTVRATNTGATVVIDHQGQLVRALAPHTRGVLTAVVDGRTGLTPYAWWTARAGLWPLVVGAGLVLLWAAWRRAGHHQRGARGLSSAARTG